VTGGVVRHLAQAGLEIGFQLAFLVPQHQIFERIEESVFHLLHIRVIGEHQRQFLLEHQHAGRNQRGQIPALIDQFGELRNVDFLVGDHGFQVAQFQLRHAATTFFLGQGDRNAVVFVDGGEVFANTGFVAIHVTGGEQRDLALGATGRLTLDLPGLARQAAAQRFAVEFRQPGVGMDFSHRLHGFAHRFHPVDRIDHLRHHRNASQAADRVGAGQYAVA
jgi:hypothetical protein